MKFGNLINLFSLSEIVLALIVISGCEKESKFDKNELIGTWGSTDLVESLDFRSEHDLYKNGDYFIYRLSRDSITLQYDGILFIYVKPTTHRYRLKRNELTIDFRPACFGFRAQEIKFIRE
jgi:hypothetical protein